MAHQKWDTPVSRVMLGRPRTAPPQSWQHLLVAQGLADVPDGTIIDGTPAPGATYTRHTWPPRGRGRGESLYSPRRVGAKVRAAEVLKMHGAGHTYKQIACILGYADASGPYRAMRRAIDRLDWDHARRAELKKWR